MSPDQRPLAVSLNLLRTFEACARRESFTKAADELCVTVSAVSQQIRSLEDQLGLTLFERRPGQLIVTERGKDYAQRIRTNLQAIDRHTRDLMAQAPSGPLKVSLMPPMASRIVLPAMAEFRQQHPGKDVRIDATLRYCDLLNAEADLAIRFGRPPWEGCHHEKLLDVYVQPVCPPAMVEQYDLLNHPENLATMPLIQMTERPDSWYQYFAMRGLPAPDAAQMYLVDDYPAAMDAAEALGVTLALAPIELPLIQSGRLAAPWPAMGPLPEAIYAVTAAQATEHPDLAAFLDWLKSLLAQLPSPV